MLSESPIITRAYTHECRTDDGLICVSCPVQEATKTSCVRYPCSQCCCFLMRDHFHVTLTVSQVLDGQVAAEVVESNVTFPFIIFRLVRIGKLIKKGLQSTHGHICSFSQLSCSSSEPSHNSNISLLFLCFPLFFFIYLISQISARNGGSLLLIILSSKHVLALLLPRLLSSVRTVSSLAKATIGLFFRLART